MALGEEIAAAVGGVTVLGTRRPYAPAAVAGGLAFYPAIGLALGAAAAAAAAAVDGMSPVAAGIAGLAVLELATGGRPFLGLAATAEGLARPGDADEVRRRLRARPGIGGLLVSAAAMAVRLWAAVHLPPPARTAAFLLAPMLGRWAVTVQCYGGNPASARGRAKNMVGRARFREFGTASTVAFAATLGLIQAAGLFVLVAAALTTVGVRLLAHYRLGGLTGRLLDATAALVETTTFIVLAALAREPTAGAALALLTPR